jgi:hypothetical protein
MTGPHRGAGTTGGAGGEPLPPTVVRSGSVALECGQDEELVLDVLLLDDGRRVIPERCCSRMIDGDGDVSFERIVLLPVFAKVIDAERLMEQTVLVFHAGEVVRAYRFECLYRLMCVYADTSEDGSTPLLMKHRVRGRRCRSLLGLLDVLDIDALLEQAVAAPEGGDDQGIDVEGRTPGAGRPKLLPDAFWDEISRIGRRSRSQRGMPMWWGKLVNWLVYDTLDSEVVRRINDLRGEHGVSWHAIVPDDPDLAILRSRADEVTEIARSCDSFDDLRYRVNVRFGRGVLQRRLFEHAA